jgi:DNA-binding GntR family transcriptional regulator
MKALLSSPDVVLNQLRSEILKGTRPAGSPLRQDEIARRFGISHIPVREALRRLEAEGLALIRPRRGAAVAELSAAEIEELNEMRVVLEPCALRLAFPRIGTETLNEAGRILDRIDRKPSLWGTLNTEFHLALYEPAQRPRLLATIRSLHHNVERYLHQELKVVDNLEESQREHRELLDTISRGDVEAACRLICKHIAEPGRQLVAHLESLGLR